MFLRLDSPLSTAKTIKQTCKQRTYNATIGKVIEHILHRPANRQRANSRVRRKSFSPSAKTVHYVFIARAPRASRPCLWSQYKFIYWPPGRKKQCSLGERAHARCAYGYIRRIRKSYRSYRSLSKASTVAHIGQHLWTCVIDALFITTRRRSHDARRYLVSERLIFARVACYYVRYLFISFYIYILTYYYYLRL